MDYFSVGGGSSTEENIEILELLQKHVPHIHWELCWGDHDVGVNDVKSYSYIGVPDYQLDEAEYVIGLLEDGEDLSGYRSESRFPQLFEEDQGNYRVCKSIIAFAENVQKLISLLECIPQDDLEEYLLELSQLMSIVYTLQFDLPDCTESSYYQSCSNSCLHPGLEPFLFYHNSNDPFESKQEDQNLEETFEEIFESLQIGLLHYDDYLDTGNYRQLAIAVSEWKYQFTCKYGWGTGIVNAQRAIHYARVYLKQGKLPEPDNKIGPENYLFAHCVFNIPGVEDYEKVLVDLNSIRFQQDLSYFALNFGKTMSTYYQERFNTIDNDIWNCIVETYDITKDEKELILQCLPTEERKLVGDKNLEDWPVEEFPNGVIWDSLCNVINKRIKDAEILIRNGEMGLNIMQNWVDLYNRIMEEVLGTIHGEETYINIHLGDANGFPLYFIDILLGKIDYNNSNGYNYPLNPFKEVIIDLRRLVYQSDWPQNEIQFGRFLEWVRIFEVVGY